MLSDSAQLLKKGESRVLELQIHSLKESAGRWCERIKRNPNLRQLNEVRRLQKDFPTKQVLPKTEALDIDKGLDQFYSCLSIISPPSRMLQINLNEFEMQLEVIRVRSLLIPIRATACGRGRRNASCRPAESLTYQPSVGALPSPIDYRRKLEQEDYGVRIFDSAKKAAIISTSICERNDKLGCTARHFENVHEGIGTGAFWRLLGLSEKECENAIREEYVPENLLILDKPFENIAAQNLIFDFGSEIYVWVGRNANRIATQHAVAYAEILLAQGLNDSLFQHKFHDWQEITLHARNLYNTSAYSKTSTFQASVLCEEENAWNLGRNLVARPMEKSVLFLEEKELYRNSRNVFTENVRYFVLEGEKTLNEMDELWILKDDRCYIVKWEYRIERIVFLFLLTGIRKLDGTEREKETGRLRVTYFYWLGKKTTKTEQGLCALVLRDFDRAHFPHKRIAQGVGSNETSKIAVMNFARKIKMNYSVFEQFISEPVIDRCQLTGTEDYAVIEADHWIKPPRLFRLFEKNGEELLPANWNSSLPFSFQQDSFRDTIIVDQTNRLWVWSDKTVSTFALRVANAYWFGRSGPKTVICKTQEPDSFKALFAKWDDFVDEIDGNEPMSQSPLRCRPIELDELLQLRTKTWPLEKVKNRDLPPGIDLNRLEQYLNDDDFQSLFRMERIAFYALPHWKQIVLRKKHKLF
ncbi:unnamed protein product [Brugia pahangi]|uniref:HP domain-containing protein n=1 Tax=Brugia pahangi TaxID=6280 RepID=A0A0N4T0F1_BRUPA|nr:unnamed protein product [Brugia pahangi]